MACRQSPVEAPNHPARADSIINIANSLLNKGKVNLSLNFIDSSYRAFPDAGPIDRWKKYSFLYGIYLNYNPDLVKAGRYVDSMLLVINERKQRYKAQYAHTLFAQGDLLMAHQQFVKAFRCYYDGRSYARKNLDTCSLAQFTNKLAMLKYQQMQMPEAIDYLKQALTECSHCQATAGADDYLLLPQEILHMTGATYLETDVPHKIDSAFLYYKRGLALIDEREHLFPERNAAIQAARAILLADLGEAYLYYGSYKEAASYLDKAQEIYEHHGAFLFDALGMQMDRALLYIRTGAFPQSKALIDSLARVIQTFEGPQWEKAALIETVYTLKNTYFEQMHELDSAYYYLEKTVSHADSARKAEKALRAADLEDAFRDNWQQNKLTLLDRNNRLKNYMLLAAVMISIMAIIILLMVWSNLKHTRNSNKVISLQNKAINDQNREILERNKQINRQNDDMQRALRALEQSQADNTRMMKIAAHDLRNPIGGMMSVADLLLEEPGRSDEERELLSLLKVSGKNSLEIINSLLDVHLKSDKLKKEPVELAEMLQYCVSLLTHKAAAKRQHITLQALPFTVHANAEKLWRVVSNLVSNAIKFSPHGATITVQLEVHALNTRIVVKDQGIGVPAGMEDKIFDMFTDAKRQGTAGEQPFGLGLAISKQIVEAHSGKIWFESQPGDGTTFFVELPIKVQSN